MKKTVDGVVVDEELQIVVRLGFDEEVITQLELSSLMKKWGMLSKKESKGRDENEIGRTEFDFESDLGRTISIGSPVDSINYLKTQDKSQQIMQMRTDVAYEATIEILI
ncbi:hypothetical protein Sjap_000693 [Stephania japonica]|uniref:Uncharacterized protein n=1 Tax=Stephania japonica TaxID=461633 RepID=A0AAP0KK69_9MAGN